MVEETNKKTIEETVKIEITMAIDPNKADNIVKRFLESLDATEIDKITDVKAQKIIIESEVTYVDIKKNG